MSSRAITISAAVRRAILAHARREQPHECCGLLLGTGARVLYAVPMRNVAASPTRFRVDDTAHIDLRRMIRQLVPALSIVGVYHSHPATAAKPSERDIDEAMYSEWVYVIAGVDRRRVSVRAFRIQRGRARELMIHWH